MADLWASYSSVINTLVPHSDFIDLDSFVGKIMRMPDGPWPGWLRLAAAVEGVRVDGNQTP